MLLLPFRSFLRLLGFVCCLSLCLSLRAEANRFSTLYSFAGTELTQAGLLQGRDGAFYGTTYLGGTNGTGTVFKVNADGSGYTVLHNFTQTAPNGANTDGTNPAAALIQGADGALYGTTPSGGAGGSGTVFRLTTDGLTFTVLHNFGATVNSLPDGTYPAAALVQGADGALYGTTQAGGTNTAGTVFKVSSEGTLYTLLHAFGAADGTGANSDGAAPVAALIQGVDGLMYGTASQGGVNANGTAFSLNPDGQSFTVLHTFSFDTTGINMDGEQPLSPLVQGKDGGLYGATTVAGGNGSGTIYRIALPESHVGWVSTDGTFSLWTVNAARAYTYKNYGPFPGWHARAIADGPDGSTRVLWNNVSGALSLWRLNSASGVFAQQTYGPYQGWTATALSVGPDNITHVLWTNPNGMLALWSVETDFSTTRFEYGPFPGWTAQAVSTTTVDALTSGSVTTPQNTTHILFTRTDGTLSLWNLNTSFDTGRGGFTQISYGPYAGWTAKSVADGPDGLTRVLWDNTSGELSVWNLDNATGLPAIHNFGPYAGWTANSLSVSPNDVTHILWTHADGRLSFWDLNSSNTFAYTAYGPYAGWTAVSLGVNP